MKLWNYGDSHAARHEPDSANDIGLSWLKDATGVNSRLEAKEKLGKNYKHLVKDKWYKYIREGNRCSTLLEGSPCSPELSYAGIVTRNIEATLMTRARPGAINDLSILRMFEDYNKWHKDDIIIFGIVTPSRFILASDINKTNHQYHWFPDNAQHIFVEYGPHDDLYNLWT